MRSRDVESEDERWNMFSNVLCCVPSYFILFYCECCQLNSSWYCHYCCCIRYHCSIGSKSSSRSSSGSSTATATTTTRNNCTLFYLSRFLYRAHHFLHVRVFIPENVILLVYMTMLTQSIVTRFSQLKTHM